MVLPTRILTRDVTVTASAFLGAVMTQIANFADPVARVRMLRVYGLQLGAAAASDCRGKHSNVANITALAQRSPVHCVKERGDQKELHSCVTLRPANC